MKRHGIKHRGNVDLHRESTIHLKTPELRKGLVEGVDYEFKTLCNTGAYHIRYTESKNKVTCTYCLARIHL